MTQVTVQVVENGGIDVVQVSQPGPPGAGATVAVGTVTTLAPGSSATVTNAGTASSAVLNFGIPRGADGEASNLSNATPANLGSASAGVSPNASRADHVHAMPNAAAVGADSTGTAAAAVAAHSANGGSAHPTAVANGAAGFLSGADKAKLEGLGSLATQSAVGNITSGGAIGSTANLPIITTTGGVLTTGTFGSTAGTFCQGDDARLSDARTPTAHNQAWSTITGTPTTLSGYGITDAQPLDSDLTSIAALTTTTFGRSLLTQADASATRTTLGLGTLATQSGTFSGTSSGTNTGDQFTSTTASVLLGRGAGAGAGAAQEITLGSGLSMSGTTLSATGGGGGGTELYFDAADFIPRTTNGCGIASEETSTNRINRDLLAFDPAAIEYAQKGFAWPTGWATATVTFYWKATSGTGSCVWAARMRIFSDADAEDQAMGTAQSVTDAAASANTHRQTSATAAITPEGTVSGGKHCILEVYRDATNGSDDLAVDALLIGVLLTKAS